MPSPTAPIPITDSRSEVVLAGGVMVFPVPEGWAVAERGDRREEPGGHPEMAVVRNDGAGVQFAAYVLGSSADPASEDAGARGTERAREWTRDTTSADVSAPQTLAPFGSIVSMAAVSYRYTLSGAGREGELVFAVRRDGRAVVVFVDAAAGALSGAGSVWAPVRDAALQSFGG